MRRPPQLGQKPRPLQEKGDEPLERAVGTPQARKTMRQHPARQEGSELLLHELWQGGSVGLTLGGFEEGLEVLVDHAVQHGVLGVARPVVRGSEGHIGDVDSG